MNSSTGTVPEKRSDIREANGAGPRCIAFADDSRVALGSVREVAVALKKVVDRDDPKSVLVFDARTSRPVEFDLRGSLDDVRRRLDASDAAAEAVAKKKAAAKTSRGPGRPKLGVVGREVTLLPRHWEWLSSQPGGASVTLRKLVEKARRDSAGSDRARRAQESAYRFLSVIGGDRPGFEEASRALFANRPDDFAQEIEGWPEDVREHAHALAEEAFSTTQR